MLAKRTWNKCDDAARKLAASQKRKACPGHAIPATAVVGNPA
jgi:hypothetical protein